SPPPEGVNVLGFELEDRVTSKAVIELEGGKKIEIDLFEKDAPGTVANFAKLAGEGFYDGLVFHRVIPGFMSQGGCPTGTGTGGPGYKIKCEVSGNPNRHEPGSLSMAHAGRDTGGSQFFICHEAQRHLDGQHTVFGKVTSGLEHVTSMKGGERMAKVTVS
ncbi:MAG: peptidylprolyl isomerase, partial [Myxococcales bacterium]|nr:peptidylprolyl isomerase [Myxococcales bacterium]